MVKTTEFRILMPLTLDEYRVAQMYMKSRMQMESTSSSEGVQVIASHPFRDEEMGEGHFSHVVYHLQSKAPAWLRALAPSGALSLEEQNWNAFPHSKTVLRCPYFSKFKITIKSMHLADRGDAENALSLSPEDLAARKVEVVDIAVESRDFWSKMIGKSGIDPSKYQSKKLQRGPLLPGWQSSCEPVMTAYKCVSVDAPYWGFGKRMEQAVIMGERALFLEAHRKCFGWMDEWAGLSIEDARKIERENIESLKKKLILSNKVAPEELRGEEQEHRNDGEEGEEVEEQEVKGAAKVGQAAPPAEAAAVEVGKTLEGELAAPQSPSSKGGKGGEP